nr:aconitate hydratase [Gemmatimonadota bacterium]NIP81858.1 aconitate hydratase [Gemmatimonadota bacterium]NIR80451.1 aconitate hydratase [Gemmatimonadota bacterium]NIU33011.1 aconitate hydratase [Gemmatimonadota bacterium]NIU37395.1 aconitate hydratase AcnA [Gemmatimonadota bacterium]
MNATAKDPFGALTTVDLDEGSTGFYRLGKLEEERLVGLDRLPFSIRVLLENVLRNAGKGYVKPADVEAVAAWSPENSGADVPFMPSRVVLQDFTGVPAVVDLAAMRDGLDRLGGDPSRINPVVPADLVIDHSVQVDFFGTQYAFQRNVEKEYERNRERYTLLRWAQQGFENFSVVPPGTGIVHQVNLEYLAKVIHRRQEDGDWLAYPDTLVGTDSHTTMINGLGVLGWGVGGIEAEAVVLGQPYYMLLPEVVGMKFTGSLPEGATATDLVLTVTQMLRQHGVVGRFVEYFGEGLSNLTLPDRATLANMSPEYGATMGFFPVDDQTLRYLEGTGREPELVERVERIAKEQNLFRTDDTPDPEYTSMLELDLSTVEPSVAGPTMPEDRIALKDLRRAFDDHLPDLVPAGFELPDPDADPETRTANSWSGEGGREEVAYADDDGEHGPSEATGGARTAAPALTARDTGRRRVDLELDGEEVTIGDGSIVIAAITSCTNTSNPSVMVGAGLLAKKAVELGLDVKPWVKTSMAPGSKVVTDYLETSGLLPYLEALRFNVVGYGCTTCIGNSGPLPEKIEDAITENGLVTASVLSGNRNFEARIHPLVRANYLASPMLVVAFALAGRIDIDLYNEPLGRDPDGKPVFLADVWPSPDEIRSTIEDALEPEMFNERYAEVFEGDEQWKSLPVPEEGSLYEWDPDSTYIQHPPFFREMTTEVPEVDDITGARVLGVFGDGTTTDHISPAGAIPKREPAGEYLIEKGVEPVDFNTYGSRRGNHEVMMRGTFGNVRIRNLLLDEKEGGYTIHFPSGEETTIYDAAMRYIEEGTPLVVLGGKGYGAGSSRDWAAKGTDLLGVKAVLAESFERIHRSNLVGMGVLPLQFLEGENRESLGLTGREVYDITGLADGLAPGEKVTVTARDEDGAEVASFQAEVRL